MRPFTALSPLLALSGSAFSAPAPENDLKIRNVDECKAVTVIISVLSQYKASATSFCSSFSIPVKTVTSATARDLLLASKDPGETLLILTDHDVNAEAFYGDIHHYSHAEGVRHISSPCVPENSNC